MFVLLLPIFIELGHRLVNKYSINSSRPLEHNKLFAIMQYKCFEKISIEWFGTMGSYYSRTVKARRKLRTI